jgi:hypothetical protein
VLGPEHLNTVNSMSNLAVMLAALGDLSSARDLLQQAVHTYQQLLGPEHPTTRTAMGYLIAVQRALDESTL